VFPEQIARSRHLERKIGIEGKCLEHDLKGTETAFFDSQIGET
jgi:hypothetical protein